MSAAQSGAAVGARCEALVALSLAACLPEEERALEGADAAEEGEERWRWGPAAPTHLARPDFCLGPPARPRAVILVSQGGSGGDSHKKSWRNLGELVALKGLGEPPPRVFRVSFARGEKAALSQLQRALFDGVLAAEELPGVPALLRWISELSQWPRGKGAQRARLQRALSESAPGVQSAAERLRRALLELTEEPAASDLPARPEASLAPRSAPAHRVPRLWPMLTPARPPLERSPLSPARWPTGLRRGLGALLLFPSLESAYALAAGEYSAGELSGLPALRRCGLISEGIAGPRLRDASLRWVLTTLSRDLIARLLDEVPRAPLAPTLSALQSMAEHAETERLLAALPRLLTPSALHAHLDDPEQLGDLERLLNLLRFLRGGRNRFGYGALSERAARYPEMPPAGDPSYRLLLPQWVRGRPPAERFREGVCAALAAALAEALTGAHPPLDAGALCAWRWRHLFQHKLLSYRGLDPLLTLLKLKRPGGELIRVQSPFATVSGARRSVGSSTVYASQGRWFYWQSAHGAHCGDKTKELCGRAAALSCHWDEEQGLTPSHRRLTLLLDGDWRPRHLAALQRAGWETIDAPQELCGAQVDAPHIADALQVPAARPAASLR